YFSPIANPSIDTYVHRNRTIAGLPSVVFRWKEEDMPRIVAGAAVRGSQKWLQMLVNDHPDVLDRALAAKLAREPGQIRRLSACREDAYAEFQDDTLFERLGVQLSHRPLAAFWPRRGPVWDGLGLTTRGDLLLVEAKSHIPELLSTAAAGEVSLAHIRTSLDETRRYLGAGPRIDWATAFYQYANRLAHLYLLRVVNKLPAYLVLIYFVNDHEQGGPTTQAEWEGALTLLKSTL